MHVLMSRGVCRKGMVAAAVLVALTVVFIVSPVSAEEPGPVYTRVGLWDVDRAHWGQFVEFFKKYDQPVMEKMMADGVILEWGIDATALHSPEGYTHATWFSATSMPRGLAGGSPGAW